MPRFQIASPIGAHSWELYGRRLLAGVPATVTVTPRPDDEDPINFTVTMELDVVDGQLMCTALQVARSADGPPVTSEHLRRIPVGQWTADAAEKIAVQEIGEGGRVHAFVWPPDDFAKDGPTPEALEHIARVYAFCMASGQAPTAVLKQRFHLSRQTSSRWIATARRRGILVEEHRQIGSEG